MWQVPDAAPGNRLFGHSPLVPDSKTEIQRLLDSGLENHQAGRLGPARSAYQKVLGMDPGHAEANFLLGTLAHQAGDNATAGTLLSLAIKNDPDRAPYHNNLGLVWHGEGKAEDAVRSYRRALELDPDFADAHNNISNALKDLGQWQEAETACRKALTLQPDFVEALNNFGHILSHQGKPGEARDCYEKAIGIDPGVAGPHFNLGCLYEKQEQWEQAISAYSRALETEPDFWEALLNLGGIFKSQGRFDEAIEKFRAVLKIFPQCVDAYYSLSGSRAYTASDDDVRAMEALFGHPRCPTRDRISLAFALGKIFDDLKEFDKAFDFFLEANKLKRAIYSYSLADDIQSFHEIIDTFDADFFRTREGYGVRDETPIFIIGMPRSGTSLTEQILASHPEIHGAGEVHTLPALCFADGNFVNETFVAQAAALTQGQFKEMGEAYLSEIRGHSASARFITDKMPENFFYVGMIKAMLPNARIIHCRRDPMDTCLSNFKNNFDIEVPYAYDLEELGGYYKIYAELVDHWKAVLPGFIHDVQYEDLVADPKRLIGELLDHCGLPFDDACLNFHETRRMVRTASMYQVRQPIFTTSVGSKEHYRDKLKPLSEALG